MGVGFEAFHKIHVRMHEILAFRRIRVLAQRQRQMEQKLLQILSSVGVCHDPLQAFQYRWCLPKMLGLAMELPALAQRIGVIEE